MIAVTFALPEESKDLRKKLRDPKPAGSSAAGPWLTGALDGLSIALVHTGMGGQSASLQTRRTIGQFHPRLVISSGFAGALSDDLAVGDVVFDRRSTAFALPAPVSPRWFVGEIATATQALETPKSKAALRQSSGALAVDMETASIAAVCQESATPLVCIRGISDAARDPLPVPMEHWFDIDSQKPRALGLVCYLLLHPGRIHAFARFLAGLPEARATMTEAIVRFIHANPSA